MRLQESGEMYLESIYVLGQRSGNVRSIDISEYMGYSKPSVSRAVSLLKNAGYITMDEDNYLHLTDTGFEIAHKIYQRHTVLSALLERIGVSRETAAEDACRMEHAISDETFEAIQRFVETLTEKI
ncbi:MAG: metal-dependent transcriptional regulator [Oscillospiraceae bacterium]|nr:metal-dependent transcriptional regulator [Oscillospiraceae bacterium]